MTTWRQIRFHYDKDRKQALAEVEKMARKILVEHPNLEEFVLAMGVATFTAKEKGAEHDISTCERAYMKKLDRLLCEWDEMLCLTGEGVRFTATGKRITHW